MNREILFRGARLCDGKLVNGALVMVKENDESEEFIPNIVISYGPDTFDWYRVDPETVGQFTGMTDKNGTKIFEGDIIKVNHNSEYINSLYCEWEDCNACFVFVDKKDFENRYYLNLNNLYKDEVIGNIHDNKELLK